MKLPHLEPARFVRRPNRFGAVVTARSGDRRYIHVPNSGRLAELLRPGVEVRWAPVDAPERKTDGDLVLVRWGRRWVCVDARLPPRLLAEAVLRRGGLEPFGACAQVAFEPRLGRGRADLVVLCRSGTTWLVETKSVTLARGGTALFPDAPTMRGRRHLRDLASMVCDPEARIVPAVAFVCQRSDVHCFRPNWQTDPAFAAALREAAEGGVRVLAFKCSVGRRRIALARPIPVDLTEVE